MKMKQIKKINPTKAAISIALVALVFGIITGIFYLTDWGFSSNSIEFIAGWQGLGLEEMVSPLSALIIAPILDAIRFFVITLVIVLIYNLIAKKFSVEIEI